MCRIALEGGLVKLETEADGLKPKRQRKCKDDDEAAGDDEEPPSDIRFELDDEMDRRRLEVQARWSERSRDKRDCYSQPRYTLNPIGYGWINTEHERPE